MSGTVSVRLQKLDGPEQALIIARLAESRAANGGEFTPRVMDSLYLALGIPAPSTVHNAMRGLSTRDWARRGSGNGQWRLTPVGRAKSEEVMSEFDLAALEAEALSEHGSTLGRAVHSVVPPVLAPPALLPGLRRFLEEYPFETNVFAMTRFPEEEVPDPVADAIEAAKEACRLHGLVLHLASDRAIDDDLWTNVAGHMWASHYGIAFFEDRVDRGLNYNLTIEVGSMLMTGRRCALLKDVSIERMPTDLVGRIYKPIDLDSLDTVHDAVHSWLREDLGLGACGKC